jgi:FixJ family two-component response regulator
MQKTMLRVAIVDDEPSVRTALARLLSASLFDTKTYATAREFIDSTREFRPECLVVDIHMPEFSGLDLLRYLHRKKDKIPAVAITAFDDNEIREQCKSFGASAFLIKPLQGPILIESIRSAASVSVRT